MLVSKKRIDSIAVNLLVLRFASLSERLEYFLPGDKDDYANY